MYESSLRKRKLVESTLRMIGMRLKREILITW